MPPLWFWVHQHLPKNCGHSLQSVFWSPRQYSAICFCFGYYLADMLDSIGFSENCQMFRMQGAEFSTVSLNITQIYSIVEANLHKASSRDARTASTYYCLFVFRCDKSEKLVKIKKPIILENYVLLRLLRWSLQPMAPSKEQNKGAETYQIKAGFEFKFCQTLLISSRSANFSTRRNLRAISEESASNVPNLFMRCSWRAIFAESDFSLPPAITINCK